MSELCDCALAGSSFLRAVEQRRIDASGPLAAARVASAGLDGQIALYELPVGRASQEIDESPGATHHPVALSPPSCSSRVAHPLLLWGRGELHGVLLCGADRRVFAYFI